MVIFKIGESFSPYLIIKNTLDIFIKNETIVNGEDKKYKIQR
jgi:hypothetical protein